MNGIFLLIIIATPLAFEQKLDWYTRPAHPLTRRELSQERIWVSCKNAMSVFSRFKCEKNFFQFHWVIE